MNNQVQNHINSLDNHTSTLIEHTLIELGATLYKAVQEARSLAEIELLIDVIGEYSMMASVYGETTGRIPESFGVDLNESVLFKRDDALANHKQNEWEIYATQFKHAIYNTCKELGIKVPKLDK